MNEKLSSKGNVHDGHRKRVRSKVFENGYSQLEDHQLLELLLFYSIPRGDTNELAHILLDMFGSLFGVICASKEELMSVEGIGESTAVYLNSLSELCSRILSEPARKRKAYRTKDSLAELARSLYFDDKVEKPYVLCFDSGMRFLSKRNIGEGKADASEIKQKEITRAVVSCDASFAVLVHNHPFSSSEPSCGDIDTTRAVTIFLRKIGVALCDHIIVGCDGDCTFFSQDNELSKMLDKTIL